VTKVLIAGFGSEGDTRPFTALAAGLLRHGMTVRVCGEASGAELAARHDVPYEVLDGDLRGSMATGELGAEAVRRRDGGITGLALFRRLARRHSRSWIETLAAAGEQADIIIGSGLVTYATVAAADLIGRPFVGASPVPITPTRAFPSVFAVPGTVPRRFNRFSHEIGARALWAAFRGATNSARADLGLGPMAFEWSEVPVLYGFSPSLLPAPPDWGTGLVVCGDWALPPSRDYVPPPDLVDFLAAGEPPVYVGFGSMTGFDSGRLVDTVVEGLDGRRAVLAGGWSGAQTATLPEAVFPIERAPHTWLLPQCSLAIHHCGAGTTHAVARAGIPSVPMPFVADQPFWARMLHERGLAPEPLRWRRLTAADVASGVAEALSPGMRAVAESMSLEMAQEDGVAAARHAIEQVLIEHAG